MANVATPGTKLVALALQIRVGMKSHTFETIDLSTVWGAHHDPRHPGPPPKWQPLPKPGRPAVKVPLEGIRKSLEPFLRNGAH